MASLSRGALRLLEIPYAAAVRIRNRRYDAGRSATQRVSVPVVSVGNITLGGTGKTPAVEWLCRHFGESGVRVGIVSRGYGAKSGQPNDEALELADKLPGIPHVQNPDRVAGAKRAIAEFGCELIVLDDGFQHRRLARDFDLVLIDALEPFGFEHVFPRGTLREPLSGWSRASGFLLTRSDRVDANEREAIRRRALAFAPQALWLESTYAPQTLRATDGSEQPLDSLAGHAIAAFCGIGNPAAFRQSLTTCGYDVRQFREFPDHFAYPSETIAELAAWPNAEAAAVLCTYKDLVKIRDRWTGEKPLLALSSRLQIQTGEDQLIASLARIVARASAS